MGVTQIATPHGPAVAETDEADGRPSALLVLGHGAGGGVEAPDLMAVRRAALAAGLSVVRVTQPYRVAGRRAPAPAAQLDAAWSAVVHEIVKGYREPPPLVVGGRSSGARVACRTSVALGAAGIVCLAFPLHPPGRPERSRAEELLTGVPTLVVNGDRDPFGVPDPSPGVEVVVRPGQRHDLRGDPRGLGQLVVEWLRGRGWARP
ncbi:alpha/beta hydrolase family protein [Asanoa iriomotensis]|uniref:alpha/beta hydrolase family protein n=1 Tax=Asanoa iriomotensis TaxID=234613 RepID=UPI0019436DC4|nr:alpha/beta family hydrolase [Asanoa iriomotensis]